MSKWASTSAKTMLLAFGFVTLGTGAAYADSDVATSGNGSLLGGNQAVIDGDVPVNVCGNAVGAVLGVAGASCTDSDAVVKEPHRDIATSGNGSLLGGNQLVAELDVPVNVAGNAIGAVGGVAGAAATDADAVVRESSDRGRRGHGGRSGDRGYRSHQSSPAFTASDAEAAMELLNEATENASVLPVGDLSRSVDMGVLRQSAPAERQQQSARVHQSADYVATSGNGSLLGGNQLVAELDVPVNVAGNAVGAVLGTAGASATGSDAIVRQSADYVATSGNGSLLGGNQLVAELDVPVNVAGNAVGAVLGTAGASATGSDAIVRQSAPAAQTGIPVVGDLPELPVSDTVGQVAPYTLTETVPQAGEGYSGDDAAREAVAPLPAAAQAAPAGDPLSGLLGGLLGGAGGAGGLTGGLPL
ncbi:hypothetical protein [Nocardiopsis sp. CNT312]|uniref:hypothetical protein n=1 Tax=Nocardiopsis sp. CNT312 TaxID=1137268 RepID=UPI00049090EC|nr:hypothetical protein [Nocardiopsis sp. CNT312]